MPESGLYTNCVPDELPPHRFPSSVALLLPEMLNTGEPLSPPCTITSFLFSTHVWHSNTMLLPETPVLVQVRVTSPCPQPVVLPTLFTLVLTPATPSPVIVNSSATTSDPVFIPSVFAIRPNPRSVAFAACTKFESELRHTRPFGQPLTPRR